MPIRIVNLEEGRPTVTAGLLRLDHALASARADRLPLLKLIHGYGSSGEGGALRIEVWKALEKMRSDGSISGFLPGEDFRRSHEAGWKLSQRHKELQQDRDFGRNNRGITIVIL